MEYSLQYKFDGITVAIVYNNGELQSASTRGNGIEGSDITEAILNIKEIPKTIKYKGCVQVVGECVMPLSVLSKLNETDDFCMKNARNAVAGILNRKNVNKELCSMLKVYFYDAKIIS